MDPLLAFELLTQPWITGVGLGVLILLWWMLRRGRRQPKSTAAVESERFAQRRARATEKESNRTPSSPAPSPEALRASTPAPAAAESTSDVDTVSGSRWMQSRIPAGDASEVSDSELAVWGPTAIMSALDEAAAASGPSDAKPSTGA